METWKQPSNFYPEKGTRAVFWKLVSRTCPLGHWTLISEVMGSWRLSLRCDIYSSSWGSQAFRASNPFLRSLSSYLLKPVPTNRLPLREICNFKSSTAIYDLKGCTPSLSSEQLPVHHPLLDKTFQKQFHQFKEAWAVIASADNPMVPCNEP